jgi:uncharacterized membrane protein YfbV (UPF0208 family)
MRFPALLNSFVPIHTSESQNYLLHFWKARKKLEPIYRKNNIISSYKTETKIACTSVIAAVVHKSLFKIRVITVLLVALAFLLKNISAKNHDNANTHIRVTKVYTV